MPGTPEHWSELPPESAALLVEFARRRRGRARRAGAARARGARRPRAAASRPSSRATHEEIEVFWRVREGHARASSAGCARRARALIIEDVCVPPARIAECGARHPGAARQARLPDRASPATPRPGNLHFLLTPDFAEPADRERYEAFMDELVELIVDKYDGSLKAEHGTGRNMAPYVEREWGAKATELMWRIKQLADPGRRARPGRRAQPRPRRPPAQPQVDAGDRGGRERDACIECGFCEPVCPSRDLTTTPRQRIVLRREMARQPEGSPVREALLERVRATTAIADLRRRRHLPARLPGRRSTPASWSRSFARRERTPSARERRWRCAGRALGGRRARGARRAARRRWRARVRRPGRARG